MLLTIKSLFPSRNGVLPFLFCLVAISLLAGCAKEYIQQSAAPKVYEKILDNGLKVLVKPDTRAPVVVSQIWYKVGGSYEPAGKTGISHVLEHMMFKGTDTLGPNEFSRIIAEHGGRDNAFTSRDYTAYFQTLEKSKLEVAFRLEADRMRNLALNEHEFDKEIEVVKEERRLRTEDRPESLAYETFMATAYTKSNYRNPIIGWPQDLDSLQVEDLRTWYDNFYVPGNATLVVVGDVEPAEVFDLAERYFGQITKPLTQPTKNPAEPAQSELRRVEVKAPAKVPYLLLGYHVPVITSIDPAEDWVPYALEISAYLLDGGKSARLATALVREQQVASSVGVGYDAVSRNPTLFLIDGNPAPGATLEQLESAIKEQIELMRNELVSEKELARVKAQIVASKVYEMDSSFYQGMQLGVIETNGLHWQLAEEIHERLRAVTAEQVRDAVRQYLVDDNLTIAVLRPEAST